MEKLAIKSDLDDLKNNNNYVVGIGASAGGLEAINDLFDNMPSTTGFSFVIVQHLSPDYKSLMGELLAKHTAMQVFEAEEGMSLKKNSIYLMPSRKTIRIENGKIRLSDQKRDHQPNNAIDIFFESLAIDKAEKAIGIILSGTGTDGTKGIEVIKNNGGTIIVQDPTTAQFDGMPNSALATGYVDMILSPDMMPEEMMEFLKEAPLLRSFNALSNHEEAILLDILGLVLKSTGQDFSNYKRPTIKRRLAKRMAENSIRSLPDYYNYLENHPEEIKKLCREFLLHVTRFFRDEEAFEEIRTRVIPQIVREKKEGEMIKVWDVACSTGEEAYSLAILFEEHLSELNNTDLEVKIFASDVSQEAINTASRGLYTEDQVKSVSEERLKRFFIKESGGYRVIPALRKMIVFAQHDITKDPPFNKIDLLACRNMLIYMNPALQKNILNKLHFAINEDGYLFLGPSENISILKDVMVEVDRKWKIFKCISKTRIADIDFSHPSHKAQYINQSPSNKSKNAFTNLAEIFKETLLEEYDYAGILIDKDFEVKQALGNFKKFMEFPEGNFNFNLLKLVPTDLALALSTGIRKAIKDNERVLLRNVKVHSGQLEKLITVIIKPYLVQKVYLQPFVFIILKEEKVIPKPVDTTKYTRDEYVTARIEELEQELKDTRENLQALIEEVESANEELQSSNEEIISSNEELQSTNEELQSLNEELHTVNTEHQLKIKELIELNDDLTNYFNNTDVGQILIDHKFIIRRFTPAVTRQVNLISSDIGRSILDISTNIKNLNFTNDVKKVMESGKPIEREIVMDDEKYYLMRIAPYLRQNKKVDGVVINFIDITEVKELNYTLQAIFNSSTSGILALKSVRDENNKIVDFECLSANHAAADLLGIKSELSKKRFHEIYGKLDGKIFESYVNVVETGNSTSFETWYEGTGKWFDIVAAKMMDGLVVTFNDITEKKAISEKIRKGFEDLKLTSHQLELTNYKLEQSNLDLLQFASVASHDLKEPLRKIQVFGNILKEKAESKLEGQETKYLDKIINSTSRMQKLIDDILTLSRLSKNDTPHSEIDLNEVINQIIDDLEVSIKEKNARFEVDNLPLIKGIPGQMHQLFQNLISNAVKFNDGHPHIMIREEEISPQTAKQLNIKPKNYLSISIADNGIGFDERFSEKIFGIFQRLEKTNFEGTGIGLAIAKKIVDNHKGFIKAIGEKGKGAKFLIVLPKD